MSLPSRCAGKAPYYSKREAKKAEARVRGIIGTKMHPYRCPTCGLFHLSKATAEHRAWFRSQER